MATLQEIKEVVYKAKPNAPLERPEFRRSEDEIRAAHKQLVALAKEQPDQIVEVILTLPQFEIDRFANLLASIGEPAVEHVLEYVTDENRKITSHMVGVMGAIGDERFVDLIIDLMMPIISNPFQQRMVSQRTHIYVNALRRCDAQKALERLSPILEDGSIDSHLRFCLKHVVNQLKK